MIAVLSAYAILWGWGYSLVPHDWGGDGFSLTCYLAPWECPKANQFVEPPPVSYNVIHLIYCPTCPVRKHKNSGVCHLQQRVIGGNEIIDYGPGDFFDPKDARNHDYSCEGLFGLVPGIWRTVVTDDGVSIEYRWVDFP